MTDCNNKFGIPAIIVLNIETKNFQKPYCENIYDSICMDKTMKRDSALYSFITNDIQVLNMDKYVALFT